MEEKGQNENVDIPEVSPAGERHEIATILGGEDAFLYGNVLTEDAEDCATSSSCDSSYDWASREVSDFRSLFRSRVVLEDWVENSCVLRTLGYRSCIKLVACRENERVFHERENATNDFFYFYSSPFYDLYIRLPLTSFQMEALAIRPIVSLFLRFFRCRPVAKRGWVSLISEPGDALLELYSQSYRGFKDKFFKVSILDSGWALFFDEDGSPKFPLYWTQNPLRFTSWPEDKMTIEELEALSVLTALPHPFSSCRIINCLEHDDFDSRVFGAASKRMKEVEEETSRPLPNGMWDSSFNLSHKIDFNLDDSEKKVVESMTEQQMADAMLELASRAAMAAWHMAYASDRGVLRVELEKARTQLKDLTTEYAMKRERDQLQRERDQLATELEQSTKTVAALTKERDSLLLAAAEEQEIREEMSEAIIVEHTRGFKKALRQVAHLLQVSTEGVAFDLRKDAYEGVDARVATTEEPNVEATGGSAAGSPDVVID
ncbi:hypothetical protein LR48_Vigan08g077200 [Vigna angularis]|uniref:Uncharacterized protein n=1 Tax=Phaseolus angularis TaxID=3914 RepID=A0A0L9V4I6_PHAAN|nr:hypothetical protein LR48_Vigan08g077200 [Vigna angularis]